jgi:hypothetical protein
VKGNGLIVRRFFAPCERCGENVADPNGADRWTTHLHARLKLFARWTFRTLKLRANANPANGCIDEMAGNSPNAAEGIVVTDSDAHPVTIADVLSGRVRVTAPLKITLSQRLYYNYRMHQPSFEREVHGLGASTTPRDFRSERERQREDDGLRQTHWQQRQP